MFAKARILTRSAASVVLLPSSAIQRIEGNDFVFVMLEDDLFDARAVRVGSKLDGKVQILEGLNPGEIVAVNHAFPLKSTFLISRLGAGCADD
jgi:cobalt-zinc-cadmium efflux system membrane fusion protein